MALGFGGGFGDFFARIFFGSLVNLAVNFVVFALGVYLGAKILNMKGNSFGRAILVSLVILIASFVPQMFFFIDTFFSLLIMFAVMMATIKAVYRCEWLDALLCLIIGTVIATLAALVFQPVAANLIWD